MKRQAGALEDLPPLALSPLRELDLAEAPSEGGPAHLSAASGVVRRGEYVYVIGDDQLFLGVFRLTSQAPGELRRLFAGELPADAGDRSEHKPDLEALTVLPPFPGRPFGALLGLGSGSTPERERGFVWTLGPDGALHGEAEAVDLAPVYGLLREQVAELNVEGACVMGDRLWLLQRGNAELGSNLVAELSLEEVMGSLRRDRRIDAHELEEVRAYDLGELGGVALTFSDATPLGADLLVFTASAEGKAGHGGDGGIHGSVVGTLDPGGEVRRLRTIDRRYKVEGVHASVDTGVMDLLFVCDQDDPETASPLLSGAMPLEAALDGELTSG